MSFSKTHRLLLGLGAISGVVTFYYTNNQKKSSACFMDNKLYTVTVCEMGRQLGSVSIKGRLQAEYTGIRLKELGFPYTAMIKSTMTRAQETGDIISLSVPDVPVTNCDLLREGAPIPPEPPLGRYKPEIYKFYQDGSRIEAAFRKYFYRAEPCQEKDTYTLLVCHANVIRYFVCRALQFPAEAWLRLSLNHASITWITITPGGRCVLRVLGDSGHMPPNVITTT
ncbi:hypothetical protein NQ318_002273 [Aromia moschata]|uniref:Serine/threonine-protein phosphatase PGAM5, mitochondrial n=1 Tax=Aromia moschata TaxID=1265417 RepID=A0AAV8Z488_9CUCU|nr:hypothetical protein NQ318_002273 [Aromia moschata]